MMRLRLWWLVPLVMLLMGGAFFSYPVVMPVLSEAPLEVSIPAAQSTSPPIFYAVTTDRQVALTMDISWGDKTPTKVLDTLSALNLKVTFFISSPWANNHKDVVKQIVMAGHEVETHGHKHVNLSEFGHDTIHDNIGTSLQVIEELTGRRPQYFRPPNGDYDDLVVDTGKDLGVETVIWSVDSLDWKNPGVDYMVRRVSREVFPGAILLFHASDSAKQTADALPQVVSALKEQNYEIVTLGQLLKDREAGRVDPRGRPTKPNME